MPAPQLYERWYLYERASYLTRFRGHKTPARDDAATRSRLLPHHALGTRVVPPARPRRRQPVRAYEARENVSEDVSEEVLEETAPISALPSENAVTKNANSGAPATRDAYWRGPAALRTPPRRVPRGGRDGGRARLRRPETLHACVLDVDAALEARDGLRREAKALEEKARERRENFLQACRKG